VLEALQKGMKDNTQVMMQNVEMLKSKIGAKIDWLKLIKNLFKIQILLFLNMGKQSNLFNQNRH